MLSNFYDQYDRIKLLKYRNYQSFLKLGEAVQSPPSYKSSLKRALKGGDTGALSPTEPLWERVKLVESA